MLRNQQIYTRHGRYGGASSKVKLSESAKNALHCIRTWIVSFLRLRSQKNLYLSLQIRLNIKCLKYDTKAHFLKKAAVRSLASSAEQNNAILAEFCSLNRNSKPRIQPFENIKWWPSYKKFDVPRLLVERAGSQNKFSLK